MLARVTERVSTHETPPHGLSLVYGFEADVLWPDALPYANPTYSCTATASCVEHQRTTSTVCRFHIMRWLAQFCPLLGLSVLLSFVVHFTGYRFVSGLTTRWLSSHTELDKPEFRPTLLH